MEAKDKATDDDLERSSFSSATPPLAKTEHQKKRKPRRKSTPKYSPSHLCADLSLIRKPIKTSITSLKRVMKAYEDGTDEIRNLLANECDIIYECRVCRNMFRCFVSFISHKRIYCKSNINSGHQHHFPQGDCIDHDSTTIVQEDQDYYDSHVTTVIRDGPAKKPVRDLTDIIDRLARKAQTDRTTTLSNLYEQALSPPVINDNVMPTLTAIIPQPPVLPAPAVPSSSSSAASYLTTVNNTNNNSVTNAINKRASKRSRFARNAKIRMSHGLDTCVSAYTSDTPENIQKQSKITDLKTASQPYNSGDHKKSTTTSWATVCSIVGVANNTTCSSELNVKKRKSGRKQAQAQANSNNEQSTGSSGSRELTYCLCDQEEFGKMIECDNKLCTIGWFHFPCVAVFSEPKGDWFCPNCRDDCS